MRSDQENLDHLDLPDPDVNTAIYYVEGGIAIDRQDYYSLDKPLTVCAKAVQTIESGVTRYFILCNNRNQMFDPRESDKRYIIRNVWKFRPVKRTTFDLYVKFLKAKYTSLLTQAERGL